MFTDSQIHIFLSLAKTCSLAQTADLFSISRQAVYNTLDKLESDLACPLFFREGKKLKLTPQGELIRDFMVNISISFDYLRQKISEMDTSEIPSFSIGLDVSLMLKKESASANIFQKTAGSEYHIEIYRSSPKKLVQNMRDSISDVIITKKSYIEKWENLSFFDIRNTKYVLQVSSDNPDARSDDYYALLNYPLLAERFEGETNNEFRSRIRKEINKHGLAPWKLIEVTNPESIYVNLMVKRCVTVSTLDNWYVNAQRVKNYPLNSEDTLALIWKTDNKSPLIPQFIDLLKKND